MRSRNSRVRYLVSTFLGGGFAFQLMPDLEIEPLLADQFYADLAIRSVGVLAFGVGSVVVIGGLVRAVARKRSNSKSIC